MMANAGNGNSPTQARAEWTDFDHIGPGTLAGRYLHRFWQPVRRVEDLQAGRAVPIKIMSEDLTLYRGESGIPHLLAFRCAHRGTQLSTGWVEGDELRCFYHGWKYDASGQCTEQPAEPEPFCNRIKIRSYPTREYLGLIFVYLGEGEAPEFPRLLDFEETEYPVQTSYAMWPCNYYTQLDNAMDPCHVTIAHWHFKNPMRRDLRAEEKPWGVAVAWGSSEAAGHFELPNAHEWGGAPNGSKGSWNF